MAILREPSRWKKPRVERETSRSSELTDEEREHVRVAIRFLRVRFGTVDKLAAALRVKPTVIWWALGKRGRPTAGLALRVARVADQPVERVLDGFFPAPNACPRCGRA